MDGVVALLSFVQYFKIEFVLSQCFIYFWKKTKGVVE